MNKALIGWGQVRHTRLRPARHAFAYPSAFLMLPMRSLSSHALDRGLDGAPALAINRPGWLSFHDSDHGDGRSAAQGGSVVSLHPAPCALARPTAQTSLLSGTTWTWRC